MVVKQVWTGYWRFLRRLVAAWMLRPGSERSENVLLSGPFERKVFSISHKRLAAALVQAHRQDGEQVMSQFTEGLGEHLFVIWPRDPESKRMLARASPKWVFASQAWCPGSSSIR